MKRSFLFPLLALALALFALVAYDTLSMDGLRGLLLAWDDNTVYAAGYSDRAFRQVRSGMGLDDVRGLLGEPVGCWLRIRDAHRRFQPDLKWFPWGPDCAEPIAAEPACIERLCYSDANPHELSSFRRRDIVFENGTVVRKFTEFYDE